MSKVIRVSLPNPEGGYYNALTDSDPDHYSLFVDGAIDHILIKEKERGIQSVDSIDTQIEHGLDYVPLCYVYVEVSSGTWRQIFSRPIDTAGYWYTVNNTYLVLNNDTGVAKNFAYYIFYDNIKNE